MIFNTVPAPVIGEELLSRQGPDTLLLELASAPGGIDRAAAEKRGLFLLDAPSLPGRFSPKASGELIKEAVYTCCKKGVISDEDHWFRHVRLLLHL